MQTLFGQSSGELLTTQLNYLPRPNGDLVLVKTRQQKGSRLNHFVFNKLFLKMYNAYTTVVFRNALASPCCYLPHLVRVTQSPITNNNLSYKCGIRERTDHSSSPVFFFMLVRKCGSLTSYYLCLWNGYTYGGYSGNNSNTCESLPDTPAS